MGNGQLSNFATSNAIIPQLNFVGLTRGVAISTMRAASVGGGA